MTKQNIKIPPTKIKKITVNRPEIYFTLSTKVVKCHKSPTPTLCVDTKIVLIL